MKNYNAISRLSAQAKATILNTLEIHEKYKKAYFWSPASNSGGRRHNESKFGGQNYTIKTKLGTVEVNHSYSESCNHCYYSLNVYLDGKKKDIRVLKNILK